MHRKYLIIIFVLLLITMLYFFISQNNKSKELELTIKINAGIPYKWEYEIKDKNIVSFVKKYVVEDENKNGISGAPIYTNYVFKGLKEGSTLITFKLKNITSNKIEKIEEYYVIVDNEKNISLKEMK